MKIRILGSGTSSGVPRIGGDWGECDPSELRNRRTRASVIVEHAGTRILVDTSPDMREQLLAADIATVDAVIWTHDHADHVHGIDDLRQVFHARGRPLEGYARQRTMSVIDERFGYIFKGMTGYPPVVSQHVLPDRLRIGAIDVTVVDQPHGNIMSAGLRFEAEGAIGERCAIGYATDFHELTPAMRALYTGLDVWVVDALRRRPHPSHPTLDAVLGWIGELRPGRSALIHMDQSMDYASLVVALPTGIVPGFDGLELTC